MLFTYRQGKKEGAATIEFTNAVSVNCRYHDNIMCKDITVNFKKVSLRGKIENEIPVFDERGLSSFKEKTNVVWDETFNSQFFSFFEKIN